MGIEEIINLKTMFFFTILPGGAGGLVLFLFSLKKGRYRNNKYLAKFVIEILGAMLTASFLSTLITSSYYKPIAAFVVGIAWANIIQIIRGKITKIVEAALGETFERRIK